MAYTKRPFLDCECVMLDHGFPKGLELQMCPKHAAAPDLYAACEALLNDKPVTAYRLASLAVAKARGDGDQ